jgi:hypothetical protein
MKVKKMLVDSFGIWLFCHYNTFHVEKQHLLIVTMIMVLIQAATAVNSFIMVTIHHVL